MANGTRADVDFDRSLSDLPTFALVQSLVSVGLHDDFIVRKLRKLANLSHRRGNKMILILISWNKE